MKRLTGILAIVAIAAAGLVGSIAAAPPAAAYPNAQVELVGHGFGHGRGLGQYGSLGYAIDHGWDWTRILDHYYGATTLGDLPGGDSGFGVTVRFMDRNAADTVVIGQLTVDQDPTQPVRQATLVRRNGPDSWLIHYGSSCGGP